jgi:hypothetical protein
MRTIVLCRCGDRMHPTTTPQPVPVIYTDYECVCGNSVTVFTPEPPAPRPTLDPRHPSK